MFAKIFLQLFEGTLYGPDGGSDETTLNQGFHKGISVSLSFGWNLHHLIGQFELATTDFLQIICNCPVPKKRYIFCRISSPMQ